MGEPRKPVPREFLPGQLREYTGGYRIENFLGNTQFAKLYRGRISDDTDRIRVVTVKIWDDSLCPSAESFDIWPKMMDEVHLLRHDSVNGHQQNLAKPIGYSHNCRRPGVVYDLNPRDTLHKEILKDDFKWLQRIRVALQLARLLVFFHNYDPPYIIRNISADHILVDQDYNPVLLDFGMMVGGLVGNARDIPKQKIYGACGYVDVNIYNHGGWFIKRDVYSFGAVLLSLFAKRVVDQSRAYESNVVYWAKKYRDGCTEKDRDRVFGHVHKIFKKDPGYNRDDAQEITFLAMACVEYSATYRPTMKRAFERLQLLNVVQRFRQELGVEDSQILQ